MKKNYLIEGSNYELSYLKISGKKAVDLLGYISTEFDEPTFKLTNILFDDGTKQGVEGEHDFPYLVDYDDKTSEIIDKISEEED